MPLPIVTRNIRRGIKCRRCHAFDWQAIGGSIGKCGRCGQVESVQRIAADYFTRLDLLYPGDIYKRRDIMDHLKLAVSEYTLQKIIHANFRRLEHRKRIYFFSP
ncbi:hypothetical protein J4760_00925 [Salinicoccus sp. ID82-1]|uniref:hypothetical protein n=1 Tax=Salinicoccus TaxID=45669 RepID=UPI001643D964|nr:MULTISPECIES: hypothetical protein [Salinicoccus]MCG1008605.1 hypothetical protein [Salinicoccus sp. ID82-1]